MDTRGRLAGAGASVLGAALLTFFGDAWPGPVEIRPYQIRIAGLGYLALCALCLPALHGRVTPPMGRFVVALSLVGLPLAVVRPDGVAPAAGWLASGAALAFLVLAWAPEGPPMPAARGGGPFRWAALAVCVVAGLAIAAFQLFNRHQLARGVPNEERSLIVAGVEVHHLVWGVLLVAVVTTWGVRRVRTRPRPWGVWTLLGLGLGMVVDQWLYFARIDPSDAAYFEPSTAISAWAGLAALGLFWQLVSKRN